MLKLPQLSNLNSLKDLCSGDTEVDFFNNIIHLQVIIHFHIDFIFNVEN